MKFRKYLSFVMIMLARRRWRCSTSCTIIIRCHVLLRFWLSCRKYSSTISLYVIKGFFKAILQSISFT
jgi:hypothetical protein